MIMIKNKNKNNDTKNILAPALNCCRAVWITNTANDVTEPT